MQWKLHTSTSFFNKVVDIISMVIGVKTTAPKVKSDLFLKIEHMGNMSDITEAVTEDRKQEHEDSAPQHIVPNRVRGNVRQGKITVKRVGSSLTHKYEKVDKF